MGSIVDESWKWDTWERHTNRESNLGFINCAESSKFRGLTGFSVSPSSTPQWKGNDLLATDADKNDYDWYCLWIPASESSLNSVFRMPWIQGKNALYITYMLDLKYRLLTPPGTPLFPLLERGEPVPEHAEPPMNLIQTHTPSRASGVSNLFCHSLNSYRVWISDQTSRN